ncbi:3-hydroxyisobutyryl-CoA hydrolase-like protein 3, mitochondrial [Papaver somniferum]|uniref:3-hydroxyisobutyryl-CoA hydrolase-like protein 3, mitochondrial n=1 Tax=Papaver somniferum TaxID=3469 RepID=UPI000E6F66F1|nr:3-hydroxyisobutyryl-CoA hydrolase-like protein 3, mitochondrial [Papaver somniferum]
MFQRTVPAISEYGIGIFLDVGSSQIVERSPGGGFLGSYLGLTGQRISSPASALFFVEMQILLNSCFTCYANSWDDPDNAVKALEHVPLFIPFAVHYFAVAEGADEWRSGLMRHFKDWEKGHSFLSTSQKLVFLVPSASGNGDNRLSEVSFWVLYFSFPVHRCYLCVSSKHVKACDFEFISLQFDFAAKRCVTKAEYRITVRSALQSDFLLMVSGQFDEQGPAFFFEGCF